MENRRTEGYTEKNERTKNKPLNKNDRGKRNGNMSYKPGNPETKTTGTRTSHSTEKQWKSKGNISSKQRGPIVNKEMTIRKARRAE